MPQLDKVYAKCMKNRSEGHALYRNVSAKKLKPGACGYFDWQGDWQVIVQTDDTAALKEHGLSPLEGVRMLTDDGSEFWKGPIVSGGVKGYRADTTLRASDGTEIVVVGGKLVFSSSVQRSAILVADGRVEHHQATPAGRYREWGYKNAQALVDLSGDADTIKKKGVWIVTKTFTAKQCAISLMLSKNSETSFGVEMGSYGIKVSPSVEWWNGQKDNDWRVLQHPDGVVVFMSGIWWKSSFLSSKVKAVLDKKRQEFLAGNIGPVPVDIEISRGPSTEPEYFQLTPCAVGKDVREFGDLPRAKGTPFDESGDDDSDEGEAEKDEKYADTDADE